MNCHVPIQKYVQLHPQFALFVLSFVFGYILNYINIHSLEFVSPEKVRLGETILTSDDLVYIKPVKNLIKTGVWTDGSIGRQQYFSRPPGYSLVILPFYFLFGLKTGLFILKLFQLLLFSISTVFMLRLIENMLNDRKLAFLAALLYGVFPIASGFVFYTLTEAITPAILIFYLYYLQKGWRNSNKIYYLKASLFLALLILIRPVFAMFILPFSLLIFKSGCDTFSLWRRLQKTSIYLSIVILPICIWEIRVISICHEFPGLYPVYDKEVNTIYRPTHRAIWEFGKCWGISGKEFHEHIGPIWEQVVYPDSNIRNPIQEFISVIPKEIVQEVGALKIQRAFLAYQANVKLQKSYLDANKKLPATFRAKEQKVITIFSHFMESYKSKHWFKYHVLVPLMYLKEMSFHSNLNLYVYQHTWRGNIGMEGLRILSLLLHVGVFILLFLSFFIRKLSLFSRLLAISSFVYIVFLAYYFRELEERYTLPILPVLFLVAFESISLNQFYSYVKRKL
jgi:hypothetical protein